MLDLRVLEAADNVDSASPLEEDVHDDPVRVVLGLLVGRVIGCKAEELKDIAGVYVLGEFLDQLLLGAVEPEDLAQEDLIKLVHILASSRLLALNGVFADSFAL